MPILKGHKNNFETLKLAASQEDLALLWCWDQREERFAAVVCAVNRPDEGVGEEDYAFVPIAMMLGEENPYERFLSPGHPDYPEDKDVSEDVSAADGDEPPGLPPGFPPLEGG